jgi:bloom syndrome protein
MQVGYCENEVDCRRSLQLAHFGEMDFDTSSCKGTCDNCQRMQSQSCKEEDMSEIARQLVSFRVLLLLSLVVQIYC